MKVEFWGWLPFQKTGGVFAQSFLTKVNGRAASITTLLERFDEIFNITIS